MANWTKVREKMAAVVALVVIVIMLAVASVVFGWNIPGISHLARALGF
ncbi:MAG TPA: hypothetical protein P5069_12815 [Candidatus Hydrogenedentes bacterium]|nr:hypothetical protein [Candidatus Hydrogenedentota bacterium]HOC73009.1 hypothetical protein [Candidatus Hydrogenedentota bacterium]HOH51120.1 hypothetical protein [Candidatus Hydrogenedentota bacterium]HPA40901.1 hypothetical protein [Candidatus Hydrogenedentota bacterium]HQL95416.1 hypothetical protein [Candidatus Hydrogenedentota bacterium]